MYRYEPIGVIDMKKNDLIEYLNSQLDSFSLIDKEKLSVFTAQSIASHFSIKRNVASHHLNNLFKTNYLLKINSKPVYFLPIYLFEKMYHKYPSKNIYNSLQELEKETYQDEFNQIIGFNGSLKEMINQCKAAINYPGAGLPLLLTGSTGTGKSFLAQNIYQHALRKNIITNNKGLMILNCAEYANNPELLSAKLFGYVKGAFTGADKTTTGILKESDGGILFIDEVHRLNAESQEKLFILMDQGRYMPIGANNEWVNVNVRLIFATTENVQSSLLETFLRRIPMIVNIPDIDERGENEKLRFIYYFLQNEAIKLGKDIQVPRNIVINLLEKTYKGNVGELKNIIKTTCANTYLNSDLESPAIVIKNEHLPKNKINFHDLFRNDANYNIIIRKTGDFFSRGKIELDAEYNELQNFTFNKITQIIKSPSSFSQAITDVIKKVTMYIQSRKSKFSDNNLQSRIEEIEEDIIFLFRETTEYISEECTMMVLSYIRLVPQINAGDAELSKRILKVEKGFQQQFNYSHELMNKLKELMKLKHGIVLSKMDVMLLTIIYEYFRDKGAFTDYFSLIFAEGFYTASSIAKAVNEKMGERIFTGVSLPSDTDRAKPNIEGDIRDILYKRKIKGNCIAFIDNDQVEDIGRILHKYTNQPVAVINSISTQIIYEVGKRIKRNEGPVTILQSLTDRQLKGYIHEGAKENKNKAIIVTCMSGIGTAYKLKEMIGASISEKTNVSIIPCEFIRINSNKEKDSLFTAYDIIGIVGTVNPNVDSVPYIGLDDLMSNQGYSSLSKMFNKYLTQEEIINMNSHIVKSFSLENIVDTLTVLNPNTVITFIEDVIQSLQVAIKIPFTNDLLLSLYVHLSCLIERVATNKQHSDYLKQEMFTKNHSQFIEIVEKSFELILIEFQSSLTISETKYIYDIFNLKIPQFKY
jgi:sigma-54 dependent transcriptional regulator, gfr operon transcriptional activator